MPWSVHQVMVQNLPQRIYLPVSGTLQMIQNLYIPPFPVNGTVPFSNKLLEKF